MIPAPHLTNSQSNLLSRAAHPLVVKKSSIQSPYHRHGRARSPVSPIRKKVLVSQLPKSNVERHLNSSLTDEALRKSIEPKLIGAGLHHRAHISADNGQGGSDGGSPAHFHMEIDSPKGHQGLETRRKHEGKRSVKNKRGSRVVGYLEQRTHFESDQIRTLLEIYKRFKQRGSVDRMRLREMLHSIFGLTDETMMDRIFYVCDLDKEGGISETEWVIALSVMLRGTLEEQIAYCYDVYDVNRDQAIGREELYHCLRGSLYLIPDLANDEEFSIEEGQRELVELAMKKLDTDHDGSIKFKDFYHAVQEDPLLIQAIGPCLPKEKAMMTFLSLMDHNPRSYKTYLSHPTDISWKRDRAKHDNIENQDHFKKNKVLINESGQMKKRRLTMKKSGYNLGSGKKSNANNLTADKKKTLNAASEKQMLHRMLHDN